MYREKHKERRGTETLNELEKRAKKNRKKQKGLSPYINKDAGNVEYNISMFNRAMGSDTASQSSGESTAPTGGVGEGLDEASTSRFYQRMTPESEWAIISPYRSEYSEKENRERMVKLKSEVRKLGYGFNQLLSRWVEDGENFDEQSLFIPNMKSDEAIKLGKKYEQSSIIINNADGCYEICTTPFENNKEGDVVRKFNLSGNSPMNISDAEQVFSHRKGGAVSKPIKGGKPFRLSEVYEVFAPRASYFQNGYRMEKIFDSNKNSLEEKMNYSTVAFLTAQKDGGWIERNYGEGENINETIKRVNTDRNKALEKNLVECGYSFYKGVKGNNDYDFFAVLRDDKQSNQSFVEDINVLANKYDQDCFFSITEGKQTRYFTDGECDDASTIVVESVGEFHSAK